MASVAQWMKVQKIWIPPGKIVVLDGGYRIDMGSNLKLRRPFIWQDEMIEVRELFRRVDLVRKSQFTGFSTWESPPPSANTLSRNRLRRRRALCSVELSHLNYKEAPFESLNHLQNIRGMCTRIQRQDYPMEQKKKDVDLISRPPLLRRPVTSASVERRGRKRPPFEVGRPYSAPTIPIQSISSSSTRDLGPTPLQYAAPKLTTLYDITQKSHSTSQSSTRKSFNVLPPAFDQCPSITPSKLRVGNNCPIPCCASASEQCLSRTLKSMVDMETCGQVGLSSISAGMSNCKDHQSFTRPIKSLKNSINATSEPSINNINFFLPQPPNFESNEKLDTFAYCGWSTTNEMTTSSDIYSTCTLNCKSLARDLSSSSQDTHVVSGFKGTEREKPSFIRPISDYCNVLSETKKNCFGSKHNSRHPSPSKTPLFMKLVFDNPKTSAYQESLLERSSTPPLDVSHIDRDDIKPSKMRGGYNAVLSLHEMKLGNINTKDDLMKNQTCLSDIDNFIEKQASNYIIALDSPSNSMRSVLPENLGFVSQTSTLTTESRWLTATPGKSPHKTALHLELEKIGNNSFGIDNDEDAQIASEDTTVAVANDPNVLIKHSADPYSDFRLSMVTMIEEEGLQDRQAELEELFQYYLDLNPKVHHEVLHKVIRDIQTDYLLKMSI